jgi:hypothetical protein
MSGMRKFLIENRAVKGKQLVHCFAAWYGMLQWV